jgi:L-fuculose-phosphate aldolase
MFEPARQSVLDACHELADRGFLPGTGGNIAVRASNKIMAITPSATDYYTMTPDDVCLVDIESGRKVFGDRKPSVELGIHQRLLLFRGDFEASIHTHQPVASAMTLLGRELPIENQEDRTHLGAVAPLVGYAPSGTGFLARAFGRKLRRDASAYLLRNHGIVCGGATLRHTIDNIERLERAARDYLSRQIRKGPTAELRTKVLESLSAMQSTSRGEGR